MDKNPTSDEVKEAVRHANEEGKEGNESDEESFEDAIESVDDGRELPEGALEHWDFQNETQELSSGWKERAKSELGEQEGILKEGLVNLRQKLGDLEPSWNLPTDDAFLTRFLRARSHNFEASLGMLLKYKAARLDHPEYFACCQPQLVQKVLEAGIVTILPIKDKEARRVLLFRVGRWDPYVISREDVFSAMILLLEVLAREPFTQISGIVALVDMGGLSWGHWRLMSMDYVRAMVATVQGAFPIRFREIDIVNESFIFQAAYGLVSPFLTAKIRGRLKFHWTDLESLHRSLPARILPVDYGGDQGEVGHEHMKEALEALEPFCLSLQEVCR